MKKLSLVIRAKLATAVVDRLLINAAKRGWGSTVVQFLEQQRQDLEQDIMIVLDQKRWWK